MASGRVSQQIVFSQILCAVLTVSYANATSIVVKLSDQRIVVAADTLGIDERGIEHQDQCKIAFLGRNAFTMSGQARYSPETAFISKWDAFSEANAAYRANSSDIQAAADDWSMRAVRYFTSLFRWAPSEVRKLASAEPQNIFLVGVFVGWGADNTAKLIFEYVRFNNAGSEPIQRMSGIPSSRDLLYTTNIVTQELIEGHSDRTEKVRRQWRAKSKKVPKSEREWRWLEIFVMATSEWDKVGKKVNVLELDRDKRPSLATKSYLPQVDEQQP